MCIVCAECLERGWRGVSHARGMQWHWHAFSNRQAFTRLLPAALCALHPALHPLPSNSKHAPLPFSPFNRPPTDAAIAGLTTIFAHELVLTPPQVASRNTRSSAATSLARPTPPQRSTACVSLRPTMLSPSRGSGTSSASSARSRRRTARSSP
jgi:hypothetical protein